MEPFSSVLNAAPRVVIVGAGFGGLAAAKAMRDVPVRVTVVDRNNYHLFQPLLYQVATAGLSPAEIASPIRSILRKARNTEVLMAEVRGVDARRQEVMLSDRSLPYDYLILATGARHSYFGHDEWEEYAPGLKSIEDATLIRRRILLAFERAEMTTDPDHQMSELTFVIVGGGPTGVEMAGAIAELARRTLTKDFRHIDLKSTRILLVESGPRILNAFPEDLSAKAIKALERLGVEVWLNSAVEKVAADSVRIKGEIVRAGTVIWAAGVAATPVGKWLGVETDKVGRVKVNADFSVPGHPKVFIVGDAALAMQDGKELPGLAPVARQEGEYVARVIAGRLGQSPPPTAFRFHDRGRLATIGRSSAIGLVGNLKLSGFFAWLAWLIVHVLYLTGFRNKLIVLIQWAWSYFMFQRGVRLITFGEQEIASGAPTERESKSKFTERPA